MIWADERCCCNGGLAGLVLYICNLHVDCIIGHVIW